MFDQSKIHGTRYTDSCCVCVCDSKICLFFQHCSTTDKSRKKSLKFHRTNVFYSNMIERILVCRMLKWNQAMVAPSLFTAARCETKLNLNLNLITLITFFLAMNQNGVSHLFVCGFTFYRFGGIKQSTHTQRILASSAGGSIFVFTSLTVLHVQILLHCSWN